ncbi:MAG: hypothetical protein IID42_07895 [Planctomycetes bacterium]|nr:hypothetical protein [Planctomycetota bacterium]
MNENDQPGNPTDESRKSVPPSPSSGVPESSPSECGQVPTSREHGSDTAPADRFRPIETDILCPSCSYNLRGLTSNRCPECGLALDAVRDHTSQIPWVHRKKIGWYRAYWKTVWFVTTRRRQMSTETAMPVSYRDAQKFRWLTVLHAYLPILAATAVLYTQAPASWTAPGSSFPGLMATRPALALPGFMATRPAWLALAFLEIWPVALVHLGILLWLAAATGVASYFFHPRDLPVHLQNRAVALSYYANAALAFTFVPLLLGWMIWESFGIDSWLTITLVSVILSIQLGAWAFDSVGILVRTPGIRSARVRVMAVLLPVLWLVLAVVIIPGVPALILGALIVLDSLA